MPLPIPLPSGSKSLCAALEARYTKTMKKLACLVGAAVGCGSPSAGSSPTSISASTETGSGTESGSGSSLTEGGATSTADETTGASTQWDDTNAETSDILDLPECRNSESDDGATGCGDCTIFSDFSHRPTSELIDGALRFSPDGLEFALPLRILEHADEDGFFFLTSEALSTAMNGVGYWNAEWSAITNGILEYERCGAHVGNDSWMTGGGIQSFYIRAYTIEESSAELHDSIECLAPTLVENTGAMFDIIERSELMGWTRSQIRYSVQYGDFGGGSTVDVASIDLCSGTAVLVFMYPGAASDTPQQEIDAVIASTCVFDGSSGTCCAF